jgi:hypothetical protein
MMMCEEVGQNENGNVIHDELSHVGINIPSLRTFISSALGRRLDQI